jgi:hypothetical protein
MNNENQKHQNDDKATQTTVEQPKKRPAIIEIAEADLESISGGLMLAGRCPPDGD